MHTRGVEVIAKEATIVGFVVENDEHSLPKIWVCNQPECPIIVRMEGLRVVQTGHVTCLRCLRPMRLLEGVTVH
jgi:hypothetical protein